jgi:putative chitinase
MLPITSSQLQQIYTTTKLDTINLYIDALNFFMEQGEINTRLRISAFLSQIGVESGNLTVVKENLNYSAQGLLKTFPRYFTSQTMAEQYQRKPDMIANRVYANRLGNGAEESGDGWRYRGRGLIQVTGRTNYQRFADDRGLTLSDAISYLETPDGAAESAVWYWTWRKINKYADEQDITMVSKLVNGGTHGLDERIGLYQQALVVL